MKRDRSSYSTLLLPVLGVSAVFSLGIAASVVDSDTPDYSLTAPQAQEADANQRPTGAGTKADGPADDAVSGLKNDPAGATVNQSTTGSLTPPLVQIPATPEKYSSADQARSEAGIDVEKAVDDMQGARSGG